MRPDAPNLLVWQAPTPTKTGWFTSATDLRLLTADKAQLYRESAPQRHASPVYHQAIIPSSLHYTVRIAAASKSLICTKHSSKTTNTQISWMIMQTQTVHQSSLYNQV
ncbi:hypothetical protein GOODEAATRI_019295 [Goodea atripinnis]|uniref:Uncharacterized protein n=1 Tax=Goodea atripinnis TaxID=208336 RepID=A0ABV0PPY9_9TELE